MTSQTKSQSPLAIAGIPVTDLSVLLVVLIWGANFSIVKVALNQFPPLIFTALRFLIAAIALAIILLRREGTLAFPPGTAWKLIGLGILGNTIYQIGFIFGLSMTTAANSALLISITPALIAVLGAVLGIERVTRTVGGGIVLALIGVGLVLAARGLSLSSETLTGDLLTFGAAWCWAAYTLGVRVLGNRMSTLRITTLSTIAGVPGLLLASIPEFQHMQWGSVTGFGWLGLSYSAFLALVVGYLLWNTSVRRIGSNRTAIYSCAIPLVAALVAWPVLGEQPKPLQLVGAALIIGGVLLTRR